uniref:ATP synthase subunit a n=1 Tax=Erpobdella japonica TaxID=184739 RepID=A0A343KJQ4_9ANNE|nr:ATP synthase F0 subunit 6 [Erpobdella japonica]ATG87478.1 ATP synthase F0 subunit 6 [Erpobdella japonica]
MLMDIFSSFDSYQYNAFFPFNSLFNMVIITSSIILTSIMISNIWMTLSSIQSTTVHSMMLMYDQAMRTKSKFLKGYSIILISLFVMIIALNLLGLVAYTFSSTSHLMFTLLVGLPLWLTMIMSSFINNKSDFMAHLLPSGAPSWLNPFLVLIETVSITVRPLTLSFRLAANSAYCIVYRLIGMFSISIILYFSMPYLTNICMSIAYILFELAICLIQAYIFCLLLSLYTDDHS